MCSSHTIYRFLIATAATAAAAATTTADSNPCGNAKIQWSPCEGKLYQGLQCGTLCVPLDYTDPESNETLQLKLTKAPATSQPAKGSIQLNFGGPGSPGKSGLAKSAPDLLPLSGGEYDLIALDPRATGDTLTVTCGDNELEGQQWAREMSSKSSNVAVGSIWENWNAHAKKCAQTASKNGTLVGTAFVARDLMSVVDALDEDGMLRYWGFSYGTTLGATVASMFPDRMDKVILDGVQNVHEYYHALSDLEEWADSDKVFSGIFSSCVEAGDACALAQGANTTAAKLEQDVLNLMEGIKYRPLAYNTSVLDYTTLKGIVASALYNTASWPKLAEIFSMLLKGVILDGVISTPEENAANHVTTASLLAIHCSDRTARTSSFEEFSAVVDQLHHQSEIMGDLDSPIQAACAQWKMDAKEHYQGDFHVKTKNPLLFIGNTYDGHTPIRSAHNVSSGFDGSVVLEVNGYGHASIALPSKCVLETASSYWRNGTLPAPGTVCQVDAPPYSNITWQDVFQSASGNGTQSTKRSRNMIRRRDF